MQSNAYQLLSLAARALFVLLAGLVALRAAGMLLREHRARKRLLRRLPDAGMVGELRDMEEDKGYPLPREGTLGSGRGCDIRLRGLKRRQVDFAYVDGKGILFTPCHRRSDTLLDEAPIHRGAYALHGAVLRAGGYTLRVRLFSGLNVPHPAQYQQQHWQPVYEEELYGSDLMGAHAPQPFAASPQQSGPAYGPAASQWMATMPVPVIRPAPEEDGETPPPFGQEAGELPPQEAPAYDAALDDAPAYNAPIYDAPAYDAPPQWVSPQPIQADPMPTGASLPEDDGEAPPPFETPARHRRSDRRREV